MLPFLIALRGAALFFRSAFFLWRPPRFGRHGPDRRAQPFFLPLEIALNAFEALGILRFLCFQGSALIQMIGNQRILFVPVPQEGFIGVQRIAVPDLSMFAAQPIPNPRQTRPEAGLPFLGFGKVPRSILAAPSLRL